MPVYEYECRKCGETFTRTLSIQEHGSAKVKCPKCSSVKVGQKISLFGVKTSRKS